MSEQVFTLNAAQFDYLLTSAILYDEKCLGGTRKLEEIFKNIRRFNKTLVKQDYFGVKEQTVFDRKRREEKKLAKQLFKSHQGKDIYYQTSLQYSKAKLLGIDSNNKTNMIVLSQNNQKLTIPAIMIIKEIPDHYFYSEYHNAYFEPTEEFLQSYSKRLERLS